MTEITFEFNELVSLRTFLIATIFRFFDMSEMETVTGYESHHVLSLVSKIDKNLDGRLEKINMDFSYEEISVMANCIMFGYMGIDIYGKNKQDIDYEGYDFAAVAEKIREIANRTK